jgi:hypothetical protein
MGTDELRAAHSDSDHSGTHDTEHRRSLTSTIGIAGQDVVPHATEQLDRLQ